MCFGSLLTDQGNYLEPFYCAVQISLAVWVLQVLKFRLPPAERIIVAKLRMLQLMNLNQYKKLYTGDVTVQANSGRWEIFYTIQDRRPISLQKIFILILTIRFWLKSRLISKAKRPHNVCKLCNHTLQLTLVLCSA